MCFSALGVALCQAQTRPDAGSLIAPKPAPPAVVLPESPQLVLPRPKAAATQGNSVRIVPSAFRFTGNSLFSSDALGALLADALGKPTDLAGLASAAAKVAAFYQSEGYLLTDVYLPEQAFAATGGAVTFAVIEAKIGQAGAQIQAGRQPVDRLFVDALVARQLPKNAEVTEYLLDKPVLLLRDLAGYDATATVEPGNELGEVNVGVRVTSKGFYADGSVTLDNHGSSAAGATRAMAAVNLNNLAGRGDVLSASGQVSDQSGSSLYRLGYQLPVGALGTRLSISAARLNYALGKQFATLGATGTADILGFGLSHPLVRSRAVNVYAQLNIEQKRLVDKTANPALSSERAVDVMRAGLSGNFTDNLLGGTALSSYIASASIGRLALSPADLAQDAGVGGLQTAGSFKKLNLDFQRTQYFVGASSLHFTGQAQLASKNLSSAERISLGGPNGVRAYPVGQSIGDAGSTFSLEFRYPLSSAMRPFNQPISLVTFYDYGYVRQNQNGAVVPGAINSTTLGGAGVGFMLGRAGNFLVRTHLAWRTTRALPTTGDADSSPRGWLQAQFWF